MGSRRRDDLELGSRHRRQLAAPRSRRQLIAWAAVGVAVTLFAAASLLWFTRKPAAPAAAVQHSAAAPASAAPAPPPPAAAPGPATTGAASAPPELTADFAQLAAKLPAVVGIAVSAVGGGQEPMQLGEWKSGPAWSTIKVPLVIAALHNDESHTVTDSMTAAITESDNAAAEAIWAGLGDPATAGQKVDDVLRQAHDPTVVQTQRVRPPFTAFGQTQWPLTEQVRFASAAFCDKADTPVFDLMGRIVEGQSWGIGTIAGTRYKGGWGPSPSGDYLVRQIGVVTGPNGKIAVALAAQPSSGKFDDGIADLNEIANWLNTHLKALPAGDCGP